MIEHKIFHRTGLKLDGSCRVRNAVRAIIVEKGKIVLAYLDTTNEYKFPGGGIKEGESVEQALRREVYEEIGATVSSIGEKIAIIQEYDKRPDEIEDYFTMISHYYLVQIEDKQAIGAVSEYLDDYEKALGFRPAEVSIEEALRINRENIESKNSRATKWIHRETYMLERLHELYSRHSS